VHSAVAITLATAAASTTEGCGTASTLPDPAPAWCPGGALTSEMARTADSCSARGVSEASPAVAERRRKGRLGGYPEAWTRGRRGARRPRDGATLGACLTCGPRRQRMAGRWRVPGRCGAPPA
jgi:hypothetical protein